MNLLRQGFRKLSSIDRHIDRHNR